MKYLVKKPGVGGFTLIEMLVVISIIGLLATLGMVAYSSAQAKARFIARVQRIDAIARALDLYYYDHGAYPILSNGNHSFFSFSGLDQLGPALSPYISYLPPDTGSGVAMAYVYNNKDDPPLSVNGGSECFQLNYGYYIIFQQWDGTGWMTNDLTRGDGGLNDAAFERVAGDYRIGTATSSLLTGGTCN